MFQGLGWLLSWQPHALLFPERSTCSAPCGSGKKSWDLHRIPAPNDGTAGAEMSAGKCSFPLINDFNGYIGSEKRTDGCCRQTDRPASNQNLRLQHKLKLKSPPSILTISFMVSRIPGFFLLAPWKHRAGVCEGSGGICLLTQNCSICILAASLAGGGWRKRRIGPARDRLQLLSSLNTMENIQSRVLSFFYRRITLKILNQLFVLISFTLCFSWRKELYEWSLKLEQSCRNTHKNTNIWRSTFVCCLVSIYYFAGYETN